jgi:hypothetical protein
MIFLLAVSELLVALIFPVEFLVNVLSGDSDRKILGRIILNTFHDFVSHLFILDALKFRVHTEVRSDNSVGDFS